MNLWLGPNSIAHSAEGVVPDDQLPAAHRKAVELLMQLNRAGCRYMAANGRLLVYGPKAARSNPELKAHKETIIALLTSHPEEPCKGGCGKLLPAGQSCIECAIRMAMEGAK
jgi:hypothetical protein